MIKVFIVEDDPMVIEVNKGFLEKLSSFSSVGTAQSGKEALHKIKDLRPDLVLLDIYLPDLSGLEVLSHIREQRIPSDVIMITAARDAETIREVFRLGATDYIVKPFRFERFKAALVVYLKMWEKFNRFDTLRQEDIDEWKSTASKPDDLPKGLSEITLKQVMMQLLNQKEPVTAAELADMLGMARVTVRRYLEYLEQKGKVKVHIHYGNVGRPSHYYSM